MMAACGSPLEHICSLPEACQVHGSACMYLLSACTGLAQALAHSTRRLVAAILTGIEDATIGTIISWLALREKLPSAQSLSSLGVLAAQALAGMHLTLHSALCAGWAQLAGCR